jgi:uncharacterized protein with PIN domain
VYPKLGEAEITLTEIEELVLEVGEGITQVMSEVEEPRRLVCPQCKGETVYKGKKARQVVTVTGTVRIRRNYFYCPACEQGFFPPG